VVLFCPDWRDEVPDGDVDEDVFEDVVRLDVDGVSVDVTIIIAVEPSPDEVVTEVIVVGGAVLEVVSGVDEDEVVVCGIELLLLDDVDVVVSEVVVGVKDDEVVVGVGVVDVVGVSVVVSGVVVSGVVADVGLLLVLELVWLGEELDELGGVLDEEESWVGAASVGVDEPLEDMMNCLP